MGRAEPACSSGERVALCFPRGPARLCEEQTLRRQKNAAKEIKRNKKQ